MSNILVILIAMYITDIEVNDGRKSAIFFILNKLTFLRGIYHTLKQHNTWFQWRYIISF